MSGDAKAILPPMKWAQRSDKIYLTINISDCKNVELTFKENGLQFKGTASNKNYECDLEFFGELDTEKCKYVVQDREIPCLILKKDDGPFWPRLLKAAGKAHFLATDFNKWVDEDDEDAEPGAASMGDANFEEMMSKMGNFNAGDAEGFGGDGEADSDDEDLPDLEAA